MTVQCWETSDSMSGSVTNDQEAAEVRELKKRYVIGQCLGFNDAVAQIEPYAPQYTASDGAGIYWLRKKLDVNSLGKGYFDITAQYSTLVFKDDGGGEEGGGGGNYVPGSVSWDTSGNTEHITQALSEVAYPDGTDGMEEAINVSGNSVNGMDVVRPSMRYSETWVMPVSIAMSSTFVGAVYRLTGTVNQNTFRVFASGEALFMGARGQWQGDQPYVPITFDFECRPNVTDFYVKGIAEFAKEGWEHVWIRYQTESTSSTLFRRPVAAYKNRIYRKKDWADLQIIGKPIAQPKTPMTNAQARAAALANGWGFNP